MSSDVSPELVQKILEEIKSLKETPIPVAPKTWKDRGVEWFFAQGTTVIVLMMVLSALAYWNYSYFPARDAAWAKVVSDQAESFAKSLEDRDKRFIEYRTKADERTAENIKLLMVSKDKEVDRWIQVLTDKINEVKEHAERTAKKVESIMDK